MTSIDEASQLAPFTLRNHNPDVLNTIANLSNDEVFTPPELANQILDTLEKGWADSNDGANIWADHTVTFLDPFTKSGVFLREIATRLVKGLEGWMPDLQQRVNHILTKQVFGIGITQLTALLARRSVYCSKIATGKHSIVKTFERDWGNIWYERTEHTWVGGTEKLRTVGEDGKSVLKTTDGRCKYCGASQKEYERSQILESHAYSFIHTDDIKARMAGLFGDTMHFDVVIGNPPYQLSDGGSGASAMPIYQKFVDSAKSLEPRFLTMIVPSRWMSGGRGLDSFRSEMLEDGRVRNLVDFLDSRDVFPGVDVAGGVCYFLWDRDHSGVCEVQTTHKGNVSTTAVRPLLEKGLDVFVRFNEGIAILKKIIDVECGPNTEKFNLPSERQFVRHVSAQRPFGLRTFYRGAETKNSESDAFVLQSGGRGWAPRTDITESTHLIDRWKVFTSKSSSEHAGQSDKEGRRKVLSLTGVLPPASVVTETYVILGDFDTEEEARNCLSYVTTKFFRFLIVLRSSAQDISRSAYKFIPEQDFSRPWTDQDLYEKYGITSEEESFIDSLVRPMEVDFA